MTARPGLSGRRSLTVTEADTASALGSGDVPVLATPRIVAICEGAACAAVEGQLEEGTTTVGLAVDVKHLAPTAVGCSVDAEARLEAVDGRRLTFSVKVMMGDAEVARGRHVRVVVNREQFLERACCAP
ncbi:MAG: thioesterase family protein [Acidimicrobiia bacterium]